MKRIAECAYLTILYLLRSFYTVFIMKYQTGKQNDQTAVMCTDIYECFSLYLIN